jgi:hypothetical protein
MSTRLAACCAFAAFAVAIPKTVGATPIDLGHPTLTPFLGSNVCGSAPCDRSTVFDVVTGFSIDSAGIRFDPLAGGATNIEVAIYASNLNNSFSNGSASHGALLASATQAISDVGLAFYNVPIAFTFLSGQRYDLAFSATGSSWGSGLNNFEFYSYNFDSPGGPYAAGPVSVVDGACHSATDDCSNYNNSVMPHIEFDTTATTATVPEPGTLALLGTGILGFVRAVRRRRSRSDAGNLLS